MGKGRFQACALHCFWAFLLPVGIGKLAVTLCFKFLISFKLPCSFVTTGLESENNSCMYTSECCLDDITRFYF